MKKKNILIISSTYTGHGHKSIADALSEHFYKYPDINLKIVDGFELGGPVSIKIGKLYGSITRNAKELWKVMWEISYKTPQLVCEFVELTIKNNFLKLLNEFNPDIILCIHPNFNAPILSILEDQQLNIPFITLIADLVSINPLWVDKRVDYLLCPTTESKYKSLEFGISENKIKVVGFPSRFDFFKHVENYQPKDYTTTPLECLVMSGGEGSGNMSKIAKILLKNYNCNLKIVTGRNKTLKRKLEKMLIPAFPNRVKIFGFVEKINELMFSSDILFARGSPNVMLEAVCANIPIVITDVLPGQEEGNLYYAQKNNIGVVCTEYKKITTVLNDLLKNNSEKLNNIRESQLKLRDPHIAKNIVEFILNIEKNSSNTYAPLHINS